MPAKIAVIIGIVEVITPACEADVKRSAFASKIKYRAVSKSESSSINLISFLLNFSYLIYILKSFL